MTGLPLTLGANRQGTASLDRIDSSIGYVEGNVQWVLKDINIMKNVFDLGYFLELCQRVTYHRRR